MDFFVGIGAQNVGLQVQSATFCNANEFYRWREVQKTTHAKFQAHFGGEKVFANPEVIPEIQKEITRLLET